MGGRSFALVAALGLVLAPVAHAQPAGDVEMEPDAAPADAPAEPAKDPKLAKKLVAAAQQFAQKGDAAAKRKQADEAKAQYESAANAFTKAIEAGDDVNVYAELATVEEKLGKLDAAARALRHVINPKYGARPDIVKKATARFDELTSKVGLVTLTVTPEGSTISIAGEEVGVTPLAEPLILMPGTYTVSLAADGFQPKDTEIKVDAGSESERSITLEAIKITIEPPRKDAGGGPVAAPGPVHSPSKLPILVGGSVAGALLVTTVITGALATSRHSTFVAADSTTPQREDAQASGKTLAKVTDVMLAGTVVAAGFTAYWYFFKYRPGKAKFAKESAGSMTSKVGVAPWVQLDAGGVAVAGSF